MDMNSVRSQKVLQFNTQLDSQQNTKLTAAI